MPLLWVVPGWWEMRAAPPAYMIHMLCVLVMQCVSAVCMPSSTPVIWLHVRLGRTVQAWVGAPWRS